MTKAVNSMDALSLDKAAAAITYKMKITMSSAIVFL